MIRRIINAYGLEFTKYIRQPFTFLGPVLVVLLILLAPLGYPLHRDGASDYGFVAYALPMALNLFGFLMLLVYSASLVATELGSGTIRTVLVRPIRRHEFLAAKMLNGMTYALVLTGVGSLTVWALVVGLGDVAGVAYGDELVYSGSEMRRAFAFAALLNLFPQFAAVAYGIMISTFTRNTATAIGVAVGSWLVLDFMKYPLHIAPLLFSTYLEQTWAVFADRSNAFDAPFVPGAYYAVGTSLAWGLACFLIAQVALSRRNLAS